MSMATNPVDRVAGPIVLSGIVSPISGLEMLPDLQATNILAVVTVQTGRLMADIGPGATVRGSGSNLLSITGTITQINAKLATLTYVGVAAGSDMLAITTIAPGGQTVAASRVALSILPCVDPTASAADVFTIDHGTVMIDTRVIDGPSVALVSRADTVATAPTAILVNSTLAAATTLSVSSDAPGGTGPRVAIAGRVELDGVTRITGAAAATISLAQGATLFNEGNMSIDAGSALFSGTGKLVNDGSIVIDGAAGSAPVRIAPAIGGTGTITLETGASLWLDGSYAAGGTINLAAGAHTLHLASPGSFGGVIAHFDRNDAIVLDGTKVTNAIYSAQADGGTGTLSLFDGAHPIANLHFAAPEAGTVFQLGADAAGNTVIQLTQPVAATTPADLDVFRFFDAAHGTQLLTSSAAERDAIIATRPDLRFEGTAFKTIAPDQPDNNAVNVFRFFDTSNGTHFLTSSLGERDTLLASRPDMVFEPNSTLVEHLSAEAGDAAVYRFFDASTGAHFFTADVNERATILATRPDMTAEGIAFYAPTA